MHAEGWFSGLELAQIAVASVGLTVAGLEWQSVMRLRTAGETPGQRILARHAVFIEVLRLSVHVVILGTAAISVALPNPPPTMPAWIVDMLVLRKAGFLWVAIIACLGTVSARRARHAFQRAQAQDRASADA